MHSKKPHLWSFHKAHGKLTRFAGFVHALWYEGTIPEHFAVRNAVGIFDVSHMGRLLVEGKDAIRFLNHILTRDISPMNLNQGHYTLMCNEQGGIVDDLTVFRLGEERFYLVYNAGNREKDVKWLRSNLSNYEAKLNEVSDQVAMFAVQGPKAVDTMQRLTGSDLQSIPRYSCAWVPLDGFEVLLSRTGYTGEDGFEVHLWNVSVDRPQRAEELWQKILKAGSEDGIKTCGLGARDTLRLEAGMCLYGSDMDERTTPLEARLGFTVAYEKKEFLGREPILRQKQAGVARRRIGLRVLERGVPRSGDRTFSGGKQIGSISSGTYSPLLRRGIAMGYVPREYDSPGVKLSVEINPATHRRVEAEVVAMPFYDSKKYGWRRSEG